MSGFIGYQSDPDFLFPQRIGDLIPQDDLSWVVLEVTDKLDISTIINRYSFLGTNALHPRMLLKLIFYGIGTGNRSSRKIARLAAKDLGGMMLCGGQRPSWRTIARFIQAHQDQVHDLFLQVLQLCIALGMVNFGHFSLDGTKIKANASKHSAMSAGRMKKEVADLAEEISKAFDELRANDVQDTQQFGEKSSDELPEELSRKQARLEKLNHALSELKQRAQAKGKELDPKDQYNFTDPESRMMTTRKDGSQQCYNHQIIVDSQERVITVYTTSQEPNDIEQLKSTVTESRINAGRNPEKLTADTGYFSGENLEYLVSETIDAYVCPEKQENEYDKSKFTYDSERDVYICPQGRELGFYRKETKRDAASRSIYAGNCSGCPKQSQCTRAKTGNRTISRDRYEPLREQMRAKLQTDAGREIYSYRKELPEPVFGQVKQQQAFHQHLRRGLEGANHEFGLSCLVYNIKRIWHKYTNYQGAREALSRVSL
jgi:transposase